MKKKLIAFIALALCILSLTSCSSSGEKATGTYYAQIEMESGGIITLELYGDIAPITVANFKKLAEAGTYDQTIFHRVIQGFMIQGGDPTGTGYGDKSLATIKGEFSANGVKNDLSHDRGVISMARANDPNSASSQFFICDSGNYKPSLDGKYAAFGRVIAGMDVVDKIAAVATDANDRPTSVQRMKSVKMIDKATADAAVAAEAASTN